MDTKRDSEGNILRQVGMSDIYNERRKVPYNNVLDLTKSPEQNILLCVQWESIRGFNLEKIHPREAFTDEVAQKFVDTKGKTFFMNMSQSQREIFRRFPETLLIDGTHGTNQSKYILVSGLVLNSRFEGTPVFQTVMETENMDCITKALSILRQLEFDACDKVKNVITGKY